MGIMQRKNVLMGVFLLAMAFILSLLVAFTMRNQKEQIYYGVTTINKRPYYIYLWRDGTFDFVDLASSKITYHNEEDRYQWNDGMLMLKFADSDKVWYLRQEGDTLVFDGDMSVLERDDPKLKGVVFEKITE
ncbi:MAG: hypothetical protein K2H45_08180 [Acetatifactor sp.]|nr:hypothetical protein [Acetatifactor sp.]